MCFKLIQSNNIAFLLNAIQLRRDLRLGTPCFIQFCPSQNFRLAKYKAPPPLIPPSLCFSAFEKCCISLTCDGRAKWIPQTNQERDALIGQI